MCQHEPWATLLIMSLQEKTMMIESRLIVVFYLSSVLRHYGVLREFNYVSTSKSLTRLCTDH